MCLVVFSIGQHPDYPVIIAANRDEFFARPTQAAHFWQQDSNILAGKDLIAGGTWLGISRTGRFTAVTNIRRFPQATGLHSRGELTTHYLQSQLSPHQYCQELQNSATNYSPFNLFVGEISKTKTSLSYINNSQNKVIDLNEGIYGISNGLLDDNWRKVSHTQKRFTKALSQPFEPHQLLSVLRHNEKLSDSELPDTGIEHRYEQYLSSAFIDTFPINHQAYGTRSQSLITVDKEFLCQYYEVQLNQEQQIISEMDFKLQLTIS